MSVVVLMSGVDCYVVFGNLVVYSKLLFIYV